MLISGEGQYFVFWSYIAIDFWSVLFLVGLEMEKYEVVKDLGAGSFGVTKLLKNKHTKELVVMKFIERGPKV